MPAVDTNVLVRFLTADHPAQSKRASAIFAAGDVFITKSVLLESEWVLRSVYRRRGAELASVFQALADAREVIMEDEPAVRRALAWFASGLDFADALHLASRRQGGDFVTFDRKLVSAGRRLRITAVRMVG